MKLNILQNASYTDKEEHNLPKVGLALKPVNHGIVPNIVHRVLITQQNSNWVS